MKKIALILLTVFILTNGFGQADKHGNPVFNNELISEEELDGFELTSIIIPLTTTFQTKIHLFMLATILH